MRFDRSCLQWIGLVAILICAAAPLPAQFPTPAEGDFIVRDFRFKSGETLPELRIHYRTIGQPARDAQGRVTNAVLLLHGTGGSGTNFLVPRFSQVLFGPGQLLDARRYYLIIPDSIGNGRSSKPSDGLRMRFPHYEYDDAVALQYRLVTEHLGVSHLRLLLGTSMGCMHSWVWGVTYPDFMDAMMPITCYTVELGGLNRMRRKMMQDVIRNDPEWKDGNYTAQPRTGLRAAIYLSYLVGAGQLHFRTEYPTRELADKQLEAHVNRELPRRDANDMLYQYDSSRNYDPSPHLGKIQARVLHINSADDIINPPELGIAEQEIKKVKHGRFILLPIDGRTRGHGTHS
ncbi:MAG: alpha/beta fold hydrolase, partial [Terriglobia bacterium]